MKASRILMIAILIVTVFIIIGPILFIFSSAFKPEAEIFSYPFTLIPEDFTTINFQKLFNNNFGIYIWNSLKLTTIIVAIQLITSAMAAYAFSKMKWKLKDSLFLIYIASTMIPIQVIIIPQFLVVRSFGLYDTHTSLILISSFSAFTTFLTRQFFMTIPEALSEAAYIDGANDFYIFFKVILPLSKTVLATALIFSFRYFWNDFFAPLIYITTKVKKTLPLGLADFAGEFDILYGPQMAGAAIALIPVMIIFFIFQRFIVASISTSGLKS